MSVVIDLHCHLLPGIDAGPTDMDGTLAMARAYAQEGVTHVVATPHVSPNYPNTHAVIEFLDTPGLLGSRAMRGGSSESVTARLNFFSTVLAFDRM